MELSDDHGQKKRNTDNQDKGVAERLLDESDQCVCVRFTAGKPKRIRTGTAAAAAAAISVTGWPRGAQRDSQVWILNETIRPLPLCQYCS